MRKHIILTLLVKVFKKMTRQQNQKSVRFNEKNQIYLIERTKPQDIVGVKGVDKWMAFGFARIKEARDLGLPLEEIFFIEECDEDFYNI